mgnify:CR=1 FL=1
MIVLSETWLHDGISNSEFLDDRYCVFRKDRSNLSGQKTRGGGVLIAVLRQFSSVACRVDTGDREEIWISVCVGDSNIILGACYIPPGSDSTIYSDHVNLTNSIVNENPDHIICVIGDYNLPNLQWCPYNSDIQNEGYYAQKINSTIERIVCDGMSYAGLSQHNCIRNNNSVILDLVFSNHRILVCNSLPLLKCDVHHPSIIMKICDIHTPTYGSNQLPYYRDFKNAPYELLNNIFSNINWDFLNNFSDINECVDAFYQVINSHIETFVTLKKCKQNSNFPNWMDSSTKSLIIQKKVAHVEYKKSQSTDDYARYSQLRSKCKDAILSCKQSYIVRTENDILSNSKSFWSYIRSKKDSNTVPKVMYLSNNQAQSPSEIANLFASYFQSVYKRHNYTQNNSTKSNHIQPLDMNSVHISQEDIIKKLTTFDNSSSPGPDGIPTLFVKSCSLSLATPLAILFNKSMQLSAFPDTWKKSYIIPIHKNGSKCYVNNYRGISLTSCIPKVFDAIVSDVLSSAVKNIIIEEQHGFFRGRSTATNLFIFTEFVTNKLESGSEIDCIFTDISKAFDTVCIERLLEKLKLLGISDPFLGWLDSYLHNRTSNVNINGAISGTIDCSSGVPQGSHLGPVLFTLYVNDLKDILNCPFLMYADDLKLFKSINCEQDCADLQLYLDKFYTWCLLNYFTPNIKKCKRMRFSRKANGVPEFIYSIDKVPIDKVRHFCDLGVVLDTHLNFELHIDHVANKASKTLGFVIRQSQDFTNIRVFLTLYNSLVRSLFDYCSVIWSPYQNFLKLRLEKIQKKFVKFLLYKINCIYTKENYELMLKYFGLCQLETRRKYFELCFIFNILNNRINSSSILNMFSLHANGRCTRNPHLLNVPFHRRLYAQKSPLCRMACLTQQYNCLDFCGVSLNAFKHQTINSLFI